MKSLKCIIFFVVTLVMIATFVGCSNNTVTTVDDIKSRGKLIMTTSADFEPFEFYDHDQIVGIDVEIARKIADNIGVDLEVNNSSFDALTLELKNNNCDIVSAGMSYSQERAKNVDFSIPYFNASQAIIVLKGSDIKSPDDLNGKTVGVQTGTTGDTYCTESLANVQVIRYNKPVDAVTDLINNKIDAVVIDDYPATKFVEMNGDKILKLDQALTVEEYMFCVHKGNVEILELVNSTIIQMQSSGELDEIFNKFLPVE